MQQAKNKIEQVFITLKTLKCLDHLSVEQQAFIYNELALISQVSVYGLQEFLVDTMCKASSSHRKETNEQTSINNTSITIKNQF